MQFDTNSLYFFENTNTKASLNLAIEEALLNSNFTKESAVFMLWQNAPSVIIGKHQNAFEEVDMPFLKENSIELVRRSSGGGAVYHDLGNLNFTFILPHSIKNVEFKTVLNPMVEALQKMGIEAKLSGRNDILATDLQNIDKKITGAAQAKGKHATLIHGTLMIDVNLDILEHVLAGNPDKYTSKGIASVRSRVSNIKELLQSNQSQAECVKYVKNQLISFFIADIEQKLVLQSDITSILAQAKEIAKERYANAIWTLNEHPPFEFTNRKKFSFGSLRVNYRIEKGYIKKCMLEGDFFALQDIAKIEQAFENLSYNKEDIQKTLSAFNLSEYILNAPKAEDENYQEILSLFSSI